MEAKGSQTSRTGVRAAARTTSRGTRSPRARRAAEAAGQLAVEHLGVADALARRYRAAGHDPEDLRQVARLGLVTAAQRYREGAGHGFVQYAVPTISGTIKHYLRDQSWAVRPPRRLQELRLGVKDARAKLSQELGREPTDAELGNELGAAEEHIAEAKSADSAMVAEHIEPLDGVGGETGGQVIAFVDPGFERVEDREIIAAALEGTTEMERRLITMRFVDEMSQSEIAAEMGVSQMQVSRLLRRLLDRMRRQVAA